jgi:hypothetical protein
MRVLAVLLGFVLAALGVAPAGADHHPDERHKAALTAYEDSSVAPPRSPSRLLTEPVRVVGHADAVPADTAQPAERARRRRPVDHRRAEPRVHQAPSTGDRAPPSH